VLLQNGHRRGPAGLWLPSNTGKCPRSAVGPIEVAYGVDQAADEGTLGPGQEWVPDVKDQDHP